MAISRTAAALATLAAVAGLTACEAGTAPVATTTTATRTTATTTATRTTATTTATTAQPLSTTTPATVATPDTEPVLTFNGLSGLPLDATAGRYAEALGHDLAPLSDTDRQVLADHGCVVRGLTDLAGLGLMVIGADSSGPVRVISLTDGSLMATSAGLRVGDPLDRARQAYRDFVLDQPFDYFPADGSAFTARAADGARWVFIADHRDRLVEIRLGRTPEVYNPQGCV